MMGTRFWGQTVGDWSHVPMPRCAPAPHNPALMLDWRRFCSDTIVAFVRMQADLLHELTPQAPVTTNMRAFGQQLDLFDMADALDFVSLNSNATIKSKSSENACEVDFLRSLKKDNIKTPSGRERILGDRTESRACQLAGRQFAGAAGRGAVVHLPDHFARGQRRALLFLAAAAHRAGEVLRRQC